MYRRTLGGMNVQGVFKKLLKSLMVTALEYNILLTFDNTLLKPVSFNEHHDWEKKGN